MAATDSPATLSELRTHFLEMLKEITGNSATNTIADRYLNDSLQAIHQDEKWPWQERAATLRTDPAYTTGTVAVTPATSVTAVTGTSTAWTTNNQWGVANARVNYKMTLGSRGDVHRISAVGSATSITLDSATPYTGTSAITGSGYAIFNDEYALETDFADVIDTRFFDQARTIHLISPQEFYLRYPRNSHRAAPRYASLIRLAPSGNATVRVRLVLGPAPDIAYLIPYRYYTSLYAVSSGGTAQANLSAAGDEPIVPLRFRRALVTKGVALWLKTRGNRLETADRLDVETAGILAAARIGEVGGPAQPRPRLIPRVGAYWAHARRPYVTTARRLTTGSRWDQLLE